MAKVLGIEFAPLNIPLERRLQTLAVFQWVLTFLFGGFGCLFLAIYLLFFTQYYWIPLLYAVWFYYDQRTGEQGGRPIGWLRGLPVWRYMANFFPAKLVKTVELDPEKSYLFCLHPHGIFQVSGFLSFATEGTEFSRVFPGFTPHLLVLAGHFLFPFYRDYFLGAGAASVSRESIRWILTHKGHIACLVPGGAAEALEAKPGKYNLVLKKRKGFVKQALLYGAPLVPVYSFGEVEIYNQANNPEGSFLRTLQIFLMRRMGFSLPVVQGRGIFNYTFGFLPYRKPINTVVGRPIDVKKTENPTPQQIEDLHDEYMKALVRLFEENKERYGVDPSEHLHFVG